MYEIKEFCQKIDRNKPDIFQECIKSGHIDPEREEIEDLQKEEMKFKPVSMECFKL